VRTSLMRPDMIMAPGFQFIPNPIVWQNYLEVLRVGLFPDQPLSQSLFLQWVKNSVIVTIFAMLGDVVGSTLAAYGFSRVHFPGRNVIFGLVLATLMVPFHVTLVPLYVIFWKLGWINTLFPLIIPFLGGRAVYIFILRQFFMTLPLELDEAAYIDGASRLRVLWQILIPLSKPAIGTVMAFSFIENWNEFLRPLIFLNSAENLTLSVGIRWFVNASGTQFHLMMGASTLALLPVIIVFFVAQKQFVQGIALTGIKG
jgi:multiple sugar transport system permease protein